MTKTLLSLLLVSVLVVSCSGNDGNAPTFISPLFLSITNISPTQGSSTGGTLVTINGLQFETGVQVLFGGILANNIQFLSQASITCETPPAMMAGAVDVEVINADGTSAILLAGFLYLDPLSIISVSPSKGSATGGTTATIVGTSFSAGIQVFFDGNLSTNINLINGTTLTCRAPGGTVGTSVDVMVQNLNGDTATLIAAFRYAVFVINTLDSGPGSLPSPPICA